VDTELFEKLYRERFFQVYSFLMSLSGNASLSEELTQETFCRALAAREGYRGDANETTWLCAIAKNLFADSMRREKRKGELNENEDAGIDIEQRLLTAICHSASMWCSTNSTSLTVKCLNCGYSASFHLRR